MERDCYKPNNFLSYPSECYGLCFSLCFGVYLWHLCSPINYLVVDFDLLSFVAFCLDLSVGAFSIFWLIDSVPVFRSPGGKNQTFFQFRSGVSRWSNRLWWVWWPLYMSLQGLWPVKIHIIHSFMKSLRGEQGCGDNIFCPFWNLTIYSFTPFLPHWF